MVAGIVVGAEHDGASVDILIALYQPLGVGKHAFGLVEVAYQLNIHVARRLLHAQQYVVYLLHGGLERLFGVAHSLVFQRAVGKVKHSHQRDCE